MPILNSTLIIIACFLPLFFLSGMEGRLLVPLGIAFIVFEAIAIFLSLYKERKYLIHTITTAIALIAISTILPVVNMESASNISQANRLKRAWRENQSFSELSEDNKKTAWSAYIYLSDQKNAKICFLESDFKQSLINLQNKTKKA